jgi:uncharacterized membrane protein
MRMLARWNKSVAFSWALDVNDAGQVVGLQSRNGMRACLWLESGALVRLPSRPRDRGSKAVAINEHGQIVGISGTRAVLWVPKRTSS